MSAPGHGRTPIVGVHPYAELFPTLPDDELDALAESIRANGLRTPLVVTPDGLLLDGRNRWAACQRVGVEPDVVVYEGDDLAEFVLDANITRRNMSTGARAMATALVLVAAGRRENGRWRRGSVGNDECVNSASWQSRLREAGVVLDFAPYLAEQVVSGEVALKDAFSQANEIRETAEAEKIAAREQKRREIEEAKRQSERDAEIVGELAEVGSHYVDLIETGVLTPAAAWAAYREDTRKARDRAERERQGRSELYTGMARALLTLGGYGGYEDIPKLMADYDPAELDPPERAREFSLDNLRAVARFATALIEWMESQALRHAETTTPAGDVR